MGRMENSIRNTLVGTGGQVITLLIGFVTRSVFIYSLGRSYLGANGLFSNILSILSFAELGIGAAIIYALYKPLAENDEKSISALMNFYKIAYRIIGIIVAVAGVCLVPFLDVFIKDRPNISNLEFIYLMYLLNTVISYFFTYKRSIIIASQNNYINTLNQSIFLLLQNFLQIAFLVITKNYIIYLLIQITITFLSNMSISRRADKMFPYLRKNAKERIDSITKKSIGKNVFAMMFSKFAAVAVTGTSNLFISAYVGLDYVGVYSNYTLMTAMVNSVIIQVFNAFTASVGNLNAKETVDYSYTIFKRIFFLNFWIMCSVSVCLYVLFNPFITLWIGTDYLFDSGIVLVIVLNFYLYGMRHTALMYISTWGLFWQIKYKSFVEAIVNVFLCLWFLKVLNMQIMGILLAVSISTVVTNIWWEPYVVYKNVFKKPIFIYIARFILYGIISAGLIFLTDFVCDFVKLQGILGIAVKFIICIILLNIIIYLLFRKTDDFKYYKNIFLHFINKLIWRN